MGRGNSAGSGERMINREIKRISNCRDAMLRAPNDFMKRLWKRNYEILVRRRMNNAEERFQFAARSIH